MMKDYQNDIYGNGRENDAGGWQAIEQKKKTIISINRYRFIPLKRFGLYCAAVCKSGGNACIGVGVGSDG